MNLNYKRSYLIGANLLAIAPFMGAHAEGTNNSERPNIIIFLADDMGYADAGFTGATDIKTPNLDALAASGVVFTQGYATHPFSGPSRAGILSGRYQQRFGFEENPAYDPANYELGISVDETLFPARLQEAGYTTGGVGKWHLGASLPFHPNNRGFDYFYGFLGGGHDYFKIDMSLPIGEAYYQPLIENNKPATFDGYITDALSEKAAEFIDNNADDPFFLYVAYNAPHGPLQAPEEDIARYSHIEDNKRRVYAAMVDVMDRGIGTVVESLKRNGLYENTIIFFMSDNGGPQGQGYSAHNGSDNGDFRGGKGQYYEGGIHIPFMACWPSKIKGGVTYDNPVITIDVSRTAVELAGADPTSGNAMEGVNLIPFISGEESSVPHETLYWRGANGKKWAVLSSDREKYVQSKPQDTPQLYRLTEDVSETNDIVGSNAELAAELKERWNNWNQNNVESEILLYTEYHELLQEFHKEATMSKVHSGR